MNIKYKYILGVCCGYALKIPLMMLCGICMSPSSSNTPQHITQGTANATSEFQPYRCVDNSPIESESIIKYSESKYLAISECVYKAYVLIISDDNTVKINDIDDVLVNNEDFIIHDESSPPRTMIIPIIREIDQMKSSLFEYNQNLIRYMIGYNQGTVVVKIIISDVHTKYRQIIDKLIDSIRIRHISNRFLNITHLNLLRDAILQSMRLPVNNIV